MIGLLRAVLLSALGRASRLAPTERDAASGPQSDLERRLEQARRRLKATIPPPAEG